MESNTTNIPMQMIKPFGPSIVKVKLPDIIVSQLNDYVDDLVKDEKRVKTLDHGSQLAGNVNSEILLETEFMKQIQWIEFLGLVCNEWLKRTCGKELKGIELIKSWIIRQFKNEYNPVHHHSGHISGVGYLKVPRHMGNPVQENKRSNPNGNIVFVHGSANLFSNATFEIKPEVGDFYMFPNYLLHAVYPFTDTDEERRSVSFNARIDEDAALY